MPRSKLRAYLAAKEKGLEQPWLPLMIQLRDYAKALDVENVLAGFCFSRHMALEQHASGSLRSPPARPT